MPQLLRSQSRIPMPLVFIKPTEKMIHFSMQLFDLRIAYLLALCWILTLMNLLLAHLRTHLTLNSELNVL